MANYTLRQVEYFVAVAEAGSIAHAAAAVHLSQSAMSGALSDLENALSVQLVVRHHARGVTLTPAGKRLLATSRRLLASAVELQTEAHSLGESLSGAMSIGFFEVIAPHLLPDLLAAAAEAMPKLRLNVSEVDLADLAEGVADGTFELGVGYDLVDDQRLRRTPLFSLPPYVLVAASHPLAGREAVSLAELADEPLALLDLPHSRDYFQRVFAAAGVQPNVRFRSTTVESCRALVGRGLAYTVLNLRSAVSLTPDGHPVTAIALEDCSPALTAVVMEAAPSRPTRRALAVTELCSTVLARVIDA